jgi:predicted site-specific integrase-resolvase
MKTGQKTPAIAYLRTSSAANVGADKDSEQHQRAAITGFAKANGYEIEAEFYDAAVSGADPVTERPGFLAMLQRIVGNGLRTIIVESPDRFARDLAMQLAAMTCSKGSGLTSSRPALRTFSLRTRRLPFWSVRCWVPSRNSRRRAL